MVGVGGMCSKLWGWLTGEGKNGARERQVCLRCSRGGGGEWVVCGGRCSVLGVRDVGNSREWGLVGIHSSTL